MDLETGRTAPRSKNFTVKLRDVLLSTLMGLALLGLFVGMPLWVSGYWIERDGLNETLTSLFEGFAPIVSIFGGVFLWGWLRNLTESAAERNSGSMAHRLLGAITVLVGAVAVILTLALMFTFWSGGPGLNEDCPGRRC